MTAVDRHRQAAARLLTAIPHADDRVALAAAALADAEAAVLAPVLRLADELDLRAAAKSVHPMAGYDEGYREGLSDREHYAADRIRQAAGGAR